MKKVKRSKLARVTLMRVVLLSWILVTGICLLAGQAIKRENLRVYESFAKSYSRIIAENVNGDMARKYLETNTMDDYYLEVQKTMQAMVDNADLRYLYVYVPEELGIRYIWDAQSDDDSRPLNDIWYYQGDYPKDDLMKAYTDGEELFRTYKYGDMSLAAYAVPMYDSSKNIVALVEADIIMPRSEMLLPGVLLNIVVIVLIVMAIAMALFYYFTRKRIISPLEKINEATKEIVENIDSDKEMVIDVSTKDEIEMVAHSIEKMNRKLKEYIRENNAITEEKARVNTELGLAHHIQINTLPTEFPAFPDRNEFDIYASMIPAKEVGGDFYDFFLVSDNQLGMVIADVSGKGIPAAMYMMMAKSMIKAKMMSGTNPAEALMSVNNMLCDSNQGEMFVTVWAAVLDMDKNELIAADAGHENPIIKKPDGDFEVVKRKHGVVLGGFRNIIHEDYVIEMQPGTKVFVYTDGVPEAKNRDGEFYKMDRLVEALNRVKNERSEEILRGVKKDLDEFEEGTEQYDDTTMMCLEYFGKDSHISK